MKNNLLRCIDLLAHKWLQWRTDQLVKKSPDYEEMRVSKIEINQGHIDILASHPNVTMLASELSQMLTEVGAQNYFQFDMSPRADHNARPVRVTIQYASGMSPAQKCAMFEKEIETLKARLHQYEPTTE